MGQFKYIANSVQQEFIFPITLPQVLLGRKVVKENRKMRGNIKSLHWFPEILERRIVTFWTVCYVRFNELTTVWMLSDECSASVPTGLLERAFSGIW